MHFAPEAKRIFRCRDTGCTVLIDDSLKYCTEVAEAGLTAVLFDLHGTYRWNDAETLPDRVHRATSWTQAVEIIKVLEEESA